MRKVISTPLRRSFIIRIFFQNQIRIAAFQLSDQNASAAAGKKDFQKSGLTGKGAENFQRRLFWIIKEGYRDGGMEPMMLSISSSSMDSDRS